MLTKQIFIKIKLYAYLSDDNQINDLKMEFTPVVNREGWTYQYTTKENPMIYRNAEFDGLTIKK